MNIPQPSPDLVSTVRERVAANPSVMTANLAAELGVSEAEILASLPGEMCSPADPADFAAIWQTMTQWEKVTFILMNETGGVAEITGPLPAGREGHGMFNLMDPDKALKGHLFIKNLGSIWFVSKPFFNKESHSVQFLDTNGKQMFAVYCGRGEDREIIPAVKDAFLALKADVASGIVRQ